MLTPAVTACSVFLASTVSHSCANLLSFSAIWHHSLTKAQVQSLEAIQCQALKIIDSSTTGMAYKVALSLAQFASLHDRTEHLNKIFFTSITITTSRQLTLSLYPRPTTHTKQYTSIILC